MVPTIHRVNRFRELCAACLINAASVDPNPSESIALCHDATIPDLRRDEVARVLVGYLAPFPELLEVFEGGLVGTPCMGKYGVPSVYGVG